MRPVQIEFAIISILAVITLTACSPPPPVIHPEPVACCISPAPPDPAGPSPEELARAHAELMRDYGYTDAEATDAEHTMAWANRLADRMEKYASEP